MEDGLEKFFSGTSLIDLVLLAGLALMLAVRTVVMQSPWFVTAMLLSAAGLVHLADLRRRWSASSI